MLKINKKYCKFSVNKFRTVNTVRRTWWTVYWSEFSKTKASIAKEGFINYFYIGMDIENEYEENTEKS